MWYICSDLCCCGSHVSCVKYSSLMAYCKHRWAHSVAPPPSDRDSWPLCSAVGVQSCLLCLFTHQMHYSTRWNFNVYMWFTLAQDVRHVRVVRVLVLDFYGCTVSKGSIDWKLGLASGLFLPLWVCVLDWKWKRNVLYTKPQIWDMILSLVALLCGTYFGEARY